MHALFIINYPNIPYLPNVLFASLMICLLSDASRLENSILVNFLGEVSYRGLMRRNEGGSNMETPLVSFTFVACFYIYKNHCRQNSQMLGTCSIDNKTPPFLFLSLSRIHFLSSIKAKTYLRLSVHILI